MCFTLFTNSLFVLFNIGISVNELVSYKKLPVILSVNTPF